MIRSVSENRIPRRNLAIGRAINIVVARSPWLWPLLRGPVRRFFSERATGWDQRTGAGGAEYLEPLATAVLHVSPAPERILDVGCGTGEGALFLAREFPQARVRGVDLSEEMIHAAVAKVGLDPEGRIAFKVGDASSLPYPDDSFDLVAMLNMPPFFAELVRVLRPGGQVIVASSQGAATPFYTRPALLRWKFLQHGVEPVEIGDAGAGTYYVGRLPSA
jgi:ubiquinone/menaquinone biosynthesis C-methylase UbiE